MLQGVLEKNICFFWGDSSVFSCTDTDSWILPESKSEKSSASIPIPIPTCLRANTHRQINCNNSNFHGSGVMNLCLFSLN